jgi:outer membrane protein assembly factor BamA
MIWENRDSEFDPHRGNRAELDLRVAPELISSYGLMSARLELRQYFYLFNWLTIANRLETRHVTGNVPYWELSMLGGQDNLRGYPLNRFMGNSLLAYTLELRGWFLKFPELENLKFGGHLFTDTGRVFTGSDDLDDLFSGYKQTIGFGGTMSVFHPDLILRGEIGFSEDISRIYIGVGYLF